MNEKVRLIIWDLDNTFWRGTLSEGGIEYSSENQHIVERLVFRGIMNSICSKNDFEPVKQILVEKGAWDHFIFPSIDWSAKAQRVVELIEHVQLRPETVLFIDDCPRNRAEVQAAVPTMLVCSEEVIPYLLDDPLCIGKPDPGLSRLQQYKLLERRASDATQFEGGNLEFLRRSEIRVEIDYDVMAKLDRAIELISRTNQLNFTKKRLDVARAKDQLIQELSVFHNQSALIRVRDRYGDYGYCGFYLASSIHQHRMLEHFCFSCRVLGMGIEKWLYQHLGRPGLQIVQPVVAELSDATNVDWINVAEPSKLESAAAAAPPLREIRLWGGCELDALEHYLKGDAASVVTETNYWAVDALLLRRDTTVNTLLMMRNASEAARDSLMAFGLLETDLTCSLLKPMDEGTLLVVSCWGDLQVPVYRHKELGFEYSFSSSYAVEKWGDMTAINPEQCEAAVAAWGGPDKLAYRDHLGKTLAILRDKFEYVGPMTIGQACQNWQAIAEQVHRQANLVVVLPPRFGFRQEDNLIGRSHNDAVKATLRRYDNISVFDASDYQIPSDRPQDSWQHLDRMVYFRLYQHMKAFIGRNGCDRAHPVQLEVA